MKALSQSDYGLIRSLYQDVYAPDIAESILDEFTDEDLDDLTDEYIEEQVTEFFEECLEEGLDIDIVEQTICESVDTELEVLTEKVDPNEIQRRRDQSKDRLATGKAMKSAASKPKESSGGDRDAGAMARAKLKVSKQKVGSASPEKKASALSRIKGAVKKVGKAAQGGIGLAARAVGTAQRAGSAVKSAAKKGYERGKQGSGGSSSSSSDSGSSSSSSDSGSSSSSGTGPSSSSSSGGGESSAAPRKRKDGLLKRGLKKVVRGISKGVSAAAGAVKAGADSLTDRARKEDMNYNKELATIKELYSQVCDNQNEELEQIDEMGKSDAGVRSRMKISGYEPPTNWDKDANRGKGATVSPKQAEKRRRKSLRQEELEATGLFTVKEIEALVESENVDEAMSSYDRNRKRAAQRAADRNAARAAGKTGVVPGVGYVTPNKERETYTDEKGTVRHKSGAKNE